MINIAETATNVTGATMKIFGGVIMDVASPTYRREVEMGDDLELDATDPMKNPLFRVGRIVELQGVRLQNRAWSKFHSKHYQSPEKP